MPLIFLFPPAVCLQLLQDVYGPIRVEAEEGYDVSVQFDLENLPDNPGLEWDCTMRDCQHALSKLS